MKDKKHADLTAEDEVKKFAFEMGMELLKPAIKNHKDKLDDLAEKWIEGSMTNKEIVDQFIELRKEV